MTGRRDAMQSRWTLGRLLRMCPAVREDVLALVPTERPRYTSLGGVVLGNGVFAAFSMSIVLYFVSDRLAPWAVVAALLWGLFILSLDRWLISTVGPGLRRFLPRLALSVALSVVIAEPLLLGVYHTAIEEWIARDRQQAAAAHTQDLQRCNPVPGTPEAAAPLPDRCASLRLLAPDEATINLVVRRDALQAEISDLEKIVDDDNKVLADLEQRARDECNGITGPGLTGRVGDGLADNDSSKCSANCAPT